MRRSAAFLVAGVTAVAIGSPLGLPTAGAAPVPTSATRAVTVADTGPCPALVMIGVRGSGEAPQPGGGTDRYSALGVYVWSLFSGLRVRNVNSMTVKTVAVTYTALPVFPSAGQSIVAHPARFLASVRAGSTALTPLVRDWLGRCSSTAVVLAGYSQGAWVVDRTLHALTVAERSRIAGVALFGDPELQPLAPGVRMATRLGGIGAAVLLSPMLPYIPLDIAARTASYCLPHDPVCQPLTALGNIPQCVLGQCPHYDYLADGVVDKAVAFVDARLKGVRNAVTAGDPVLRPGTAVGDLNLASYCSSRSAGTSHMTRDQVGSNAAVNNWVCTGGPARTFLINMTFACRWQYRDARLIGGYLDVNNAFSWRCYL